MLRCCHRNMSQSNNLLLASIDCLSRGLMACPSRGTCWLDTNLVIPRLPTSWLAQAVARASLIDACDTS